MVWKAICFLIILESFFNQSIYSENMQIIAIDSPQQEILRQKTEDIQEDELLLAQQIAEQLFMALKPYLPAAGLAAPQIGISKSIFIYSCDRDPKNLEVVINPNFMPTNAEKYESWEGCFSVMLSSGTWKLAKVPRYKSIKAMYLDLNGRKIEKVLEGFAAKVFQHECDHLLGMININREDAMIRSFETKEEMLSFMEQVKKEDSNNYQKKPNKQ